MSDALVLGVYGVSIVLSALGFLLTTVFSTKVTSMVIRELAGPTPNLSNRNSSERKLSKETAGSTSASTATRRFRFRSVSRPSVSEQRQNGRLNMVMSVICTWIFTFYLLCRGVLSSVMFAQMWRSKRGARHKLKIILDNRDFQVVITVMFLMLAVGYSMLSIVCFERCCTVFSQSQYRLTEGVIRVIRWTIALSALGATAGLACLFWGSPLAAYILSFPSLLVYPTTLVYSTYRFFSTTRKIARNMTEMLRRHQRQTSKDVNNVHSASNLFSVNPTNESVMRKVTELMNGSLRLTLLSGSVIVSAMISIMVTIVYSYVPHPSVLLVLFLVFIFDLQCNVYCLMCTFRDFEKEYMFVFRRIHNYWLNRLLVY